MVIEVKQGDDQILASSNVMYLKNIFHFTPERLGFLILGSIYIYKNFPINPYETCKFVR
jgi:hypothetical protein